MPKEQPFAPKANPLSAALRKFATIILIAAAFAGVWYFGKWRGRQKMDKFAQCLSDKGAIMYGLFWCPHCEEQKEEFGSSFQNVRYMECGTQDHKEQPQCSQLGLKDFPTWQFSDAERHVGGLSLQDLGAKTGCPVP